MTDPALPPAPARRRPGARDLRWASGTVLMAYVALHLANHALGLVSLGAAEAALDRIHRFWRGPAGSLLLYGAAGLHLALAFRGVWERRSLRMPPAEALRIVLGFALPALLSGHLASMRGAYEAFGADAGYARAVRGLWSPGAAAFQLATMAAAWAHGCLGVHFAFRARAAWPRLLPGLLAGALLLPALAALGFLAMGREIAWTGAGAGPGTALPAAQAEAVRQAARAAAQGYAALVALLLAGRALRDRLRRRRPDGTVALRYPDRTVRMARGASVLEASRAHGIPHLSVCGGRARCSTCRVRVRGPAGALPPPGPDEARTLERVHAPEGVRLACQLRPRGDIAVAPLFRPGAREAAGRAGRERDVAVLFVDLRRWSGLSERQWPFDLVYALDRYFETVGAAVRECGGTANQFVGDSVMAIFGLDCALPSACRRAMEAAALVARRMDAWSAGFEDAFGQPLAFGMGLHAGRAVVAEVGWEDRTSFSAVGEVVNTASRLQDHSKTSAARLVASRFAAGQAEAAGWRGPPGRPERVAVRGRSAPIDVLHFALPRDR